MSFAAERVLWLALAAPLALWAAVALWRRRLAALAAWAAPGLWPRLGLEPSPRRMRLQALALGVTVLGLAVALAGPRWGSASTGVERRGVDVVFVLDSSLSMAAMDVGPSRLAVARSLIRRMIERLPGHRVGLVLAEGDGVVMVPLTLDAAAVDLVLDTVVPGTLPQPGTRLARALELAASLFPEGGEKHRALVLVSDGEDHGGGLGGVGADLAERRIVVHALGVGSPAGAPIPLPDRPGTLKRDPEGEVVLSRLGEARLESLVHPADGVYLRVTSAAADPGPILARIGRMETRRFESELLETLEPRFQWPLAAAAAALLAILLLPALREASP